MQPASGWELQGAALQLGACEELSACSCAVSCLHSSSQQLAKCMLGQGIRQQAVAAHMKCAGYCRDHRVSSMATVQP